MRGAAQKVQRLADLAAAIGESELDLLELSATELVHLLDVEHRGVGVGARAPISPWSARDRRSAEARPPSLRPAG
jgi:hypothetical protein